MIITSGINSRLAWYDRNPKSIEFIYDASPVSPHAQTTRESYTVPTGKKAILESTFCLFSRISIATTVGVVVARFDFTEDGGNEIITPKYELLDNTVGAYITGVYIFNKLMKEGDKFEITTADISVGGEMGYTISAQINEFNV